MKRKTITLMLNGLADNYISEAEVFCPETIQEPPERIAHMKKKRFITLALAAALILSLGVAGYATFCTVNSPKAAEKIALEELEKWKEMGLLSETVTTNGEAVQIVEIQEHKGSEYWYGRLFPHSYAVRFLGGEDNKYFCNLEVDTRTGKITKANFEVKADADDIPVAETTAEEPVDPDNPKGEWKQVTYYLYDNYDDIFPANMTVSHFCTLLADYWGFSGYRLADTADDFYNAHWSAVDDESLLKDMPKDNYYLTIFFEGDQEGTPMYLQLSQFPGRVYFSLGTGHLIG